MVSERHIFRRKVWFPSSDFIFRLMLGLVQCNLCVSTIFKKKTNTIYSIVLSCPVSGCVIFNWLFPSS